MKKEYINFKYSGALSSPNVKKTTTKTLLANRPRIIRLQDIFAYKDFHGVLVQRGEKGRRGGSCEMTKRIKIRCSRILREVPSTYCPTCHQEEACRKRMREYPASLPKPKQERFVFRRRGKRAV